MIDGSLGGRSGPRRGQRGRRGRRRRLPGAVAPKAKRRKKISSKTMARYAGSARVKSYDFAHPARLPDSARWLSEVQAVTCKPVTYLKG
eukprot:3168556-Prymnesium_polylepis.1